MLERGARTWCYHENYQEHKKVKVEIVCNKAKGPISERVLQENKAHQVF